MTTSVFEGRSWDQLAQVSSKRSFFLAICGALTGRVSIALIVNLRPWIRQPAGVRTYSSS